MTLSVNVMTRGPGDRVAAMLSLFRLAADEILVALDDRAGPEVEAPLAAVADRIVRYPYAEPVDRPLAWIHAECRGDWVLTVDDDEVPSRALLDALPALVASGDVTHWFLPRRWLYGAPDRWLDARPWRPDYQCRLVLNDPRVLSFPDETHVPVLVHGPARYLDAGVYHLDTLLNSAETRAAKVQRYERLHPGKRVAGRPLNEAFYLPELVDPPTAEVPSEDLELIAAVLAGESRGMERAGTGAVDRAGVDRFWAGREPGYDARLTLLEQVPPLRAGGTETVDVLVENLSDGTWPWGGSGGPAIRLGSRWVRDGAVLDGSRTPLPSDLPPGGSLRVPLALVVPAEPGRYVLEADLVHEHVRWFDRPLRVEVEVAPARRVAVLDPGALEGLLAVLATLDPEEEPVVITERPELAREFGGRLAASLEETGADRLVVPDELVQEGHRRPLLDAVATARRLGIPAQSASGADLGRTAVARRRFR